ncbi:MAG: hypothetical protein FWF25_02810 [Propionibacteriaceae bacterium]|nr:hypothetical protein [Propionibacteriaceae bacterium]
MLPLAHTVLHAPYTPSQDSLKATVDAWGKWELFKVYGWAPVTEFASSQFEQGRSTVSSLIEIFAPPGTPGQHRDKWMVGGVECEQEGVARDFTTGPFGFEPGIVIRVKQQRG